jgi:NitT/TauT family transport system permease protein
MADQGKRDAARMAESVKMADRRNFRNMVGNSRYYLTFAVAMAILLTIWYFAARAVNHPFQFPYLENVMRELVRAMSDLYVWRNVLITFRRVFTGVFYAILIGFPLGVLMGYSKFMMRLLAPFINAVRQIPITSWIPLAIIWFGLRDGPSIFVITLTAVFTIVLNTVAGVNEIAPEYYHAVRTMGASTLGVIRDVVFPGSLSGLITGARIAMGMAWMTVV